MVLFCEERFAQDFQFDRLKQTMHTVMQSAIITPTSFYCFIQRYTYFNAVVSHWVSHRATDQILLHTVGDYAQLSVPERDRIAQVPTWLTEITQALASQYQETPSDDVATLVRTLGFHAAAEMMGDLEQAVFDRLVRHNCPWCYLLIYSHDESQHALNALNLILDYRPELPEQIKAWVYEGYQSFIEVHQQLFYEIYRECLEFQYGDSDSASLQGKIPGQST